MIRRIALLVALAAVPAAAQTAAPATPDAVSPPPAAAPAKKPRPRIICRETVETGTRLGAKKECATAEEWARLQADQHEDLDRRQRQTLGGGG